MGNGKCGQMGIMVNTEDRDGAPWVMGHMGDGAHGQWDMGRGVSWLILKIEMRYLGGWGTWVMRHMANWAHDHNFLNTAWIFTKILLHIDIDVFYLNILCFLHDGPF